MSVVGFTAERPLRRFANPYTGVWRGCASGGQVIPPQEWAGLGCMWACAAVLVVPETLAPELACYSCFRGCSAIVG
ncbi:MAG: hypothetical protein WBP81_17710 [Solirubrobacteraceae bacterium]